MRVLPNTCLIAALSLTAFPVSASEWTHNTLMLGQFEGSLDNKAEGSFLHYSCSGMSSTVSFSVSGLHIAAGKSVVEVDGIQVFEGNTVYNSSWDETSISSRVQADWGQVQKDNHNRIIDALASGAEAVWTTPNEESFTFNLEGSSDIRNCKVK
ncbi:hypothetical protein [Celeribacter sp.]|uniref:hypothetical protein n=1 Tax=Celeribacter sp. TaxID=1890673 RepID=UPI003A910B56